MDHAIIYAAIVNSNLRFNKEGYFHAFLFSTRCAINELENKNFVLISYIETLVEVWENSKLQFLVLPNFHHS